MMSNVVRPPLPLIVLLDKSAGYTSRQCVNQCGKLMATRKIGHAGTLDPDATGMLPLCIGDATRFVPYLTGQSKCYEVEITLGVQTDTADASGQVINTAEVPSFSDEMLYDVLKAFIGSSLQTVPMVSAVRVAGKRLYEYARAGEPVTPPIRKIFIQDIQLLCSAGNRFKICVHSNKGVYMRALAEDISYQLGTVGHVSKLHRLWVSPFSDLTMLPHKQLLEIEAKALYQQPGVYTLSDIFSGFPRLSLSEKEKQQLYYGQKIDGTCSESAAWFALYCGQNFFGVGQVSDGQLSSLRLLPQFQESEIK